MSSTSDENDSRIKYKLITRSAFVFFGIPANLLSIWLILRAKQQASSTTRLLLNLAISDVFNLTAGFTAIASIYLINLPSDFEYDVEASTMAAKTVANLTLMFIAFERYNALVNTMAPCLILLSKKNVTRIVMMIWLVSLILHILIPVSLYAHDKILTGSHEKINTGYYIACTVLTFSLPLLVTTFCYVRILKGVFHDSTILGKVPTQQSELEEKRRFVRVLVIVTSGFFLTNLPITFLKIAKLTRDERSRKVVKAMSIFSFVSSTVNPYIYGLQSERYREQIKELFFHKEKNAVTWQQAQPAGEEVVEVNSSPNPCDVKETTRM